MNRFATIALVAALVACGGDEPSAPDSGPPDWWSDTSVDTRPVPDVAHEPDPEPEVVDAPSEDVRPDVPRSDDGAPCATSDDCTGGVCLPDPEWYSGYCTTRPCRSDRDCSGDGVICAPLGDDKACLAPCILDADCRPRYDCVLAEGRRERVCVPTDPSNIREGSADGEPCTTDAVCAGGNCLADPDWPGGYCTTTACATFRDCARGDADEFDNRCLVQQGTNFCVRLCRSAADCRNDLGYICQTIGGGQGMCVPGRAAPPARDIDFDAYPFDITCGLDHDDGTIAIEYTVAEDTTAYMVVPIAKDGARIQPSFVELPNGRLIDLEGVNGFQLAPSILFGFLNPIVVPPTSAFSEQLQPGLHRLTITTWSEDLCWYLLEEREPGATIDLNVYLVGVDGVTPESAPTDANFAAVFDQFEAIFEPAGIALGEVRYFTPAESVVEAWQILRSFDEVEALVEQSELPGETLDAALSLNVFFVRAFAFPDASGLLGVSMGLPGPAGIHGTRASGVAFTSEYLGLTLPDGTTGNAFTGLVLAHEVGHYLGLFHTTEQFGAGFDPLDDTPECRSGFPDGCPDLSNLMFPLADSSHTRITQGQVFQILANPLTRP